MPLINTQTFGLMKPSSRITARNSHLIPEINVRAKRILKSAAEEMVMANSVVRRMAELWTPYKSGTRCSCNQYKDQYDEQREMRSGMPDIATFIRSGNLRLLQDKEFCPICYGTGIEGGYDLYGTTSVVLTANSRSLKLSKGLSIKQGCPYTILCGTKGQATWTITLPRYWLQVHTIVLYWNKYPKDYSLLLNGEPFNLDIFNTLGQIPQEHVDISVEIEDTSGTVELYYLRFMLRVNRNTLVSVDVPNYTYSYSGELSVQGESQSSITANFDSQQGKIDVGSVFVMEDDGIIWRILENEFNAPLDVIISNNCQARLVRSWEKYYLLPSKPAMKTYPNDNGMVYSFVY